MTADEKMREAFEKQHEGYEFPSRDFKDAALNNFADGWYAHQKQAAQQVQVSEVLEFCYTSFGKMRKCDHLDQQIAESSQNMIKAVLAAIQGGGK